MSEELSWWEIEVETSGDDWWNTVSPEHEDIWWELESWDESDWWATFDDQNLEEGDWIQGRSKTLPIQWYQIEEYIPVDTGKEIVQITIRPATKGHHDGGFFDVLSVQRNLEHLKLFGAERVDICLEQTTQELEIPLFGAHEDSVIKAVYIYPESSVNGHDINYMKAIVKNKNTGGDICTKTYIAGNNLEAWKLDLMGPPHTVHKVIEYMNTASLVIEKHGDGFIFPRSVIIVLWDLATSRDFENAANY